MYWGTGKMDENIELKEPSEQIIENAKMSESIATDGPMIPKGKEGPKKRGRPAKAQTEKLSKKPSPEKDQEPEQTRPKFDIPSQVICYPLVKIVSVTGVAIAKDQRAAITSSEAEDMAKAMGMVMDKWMPDAMAKWGPEVMLGLSLGQYSLRVFALAKANQERQSRQSSIQPEQRPQEPAVVSKIHSISEEIPLP